LSSIKPVIPYTTRRSRGGRPISWYVLIVLAVLGLAGIAVVVAFHEEARSDFDGFVYVESNSSVRGANSILAFEFRHNTLSLLAKVPTGGTGTIDQGVTGSLDAEGQIAVDRKRRLLFAVNQGSDTVAVLRLGADGRPAPVAGSPFPSGGKSPASIGIARDLLIVANKAHDPNRILDTVAPAYVTFRIGDDGSLSPTGKTPLPLASSPTQALVVGGRLVVGTEESGPFVSYSLRADGSLASAPGSPLGAETSIFSRDYDGARWSIGLVPHPRLKLIYANQSATHKLLVYSYDDTGRLRFVHAVNNSDAKLPCWTVVSTDGRFLYTANAGNGTVSAFDLASPEAPRHLQTVTLAHGANPWGLALDPSGHTLFVVDPHAVAGVSDTLGNRLHVLAVGPDGRLNEIDGARQRLPVDNESSPLGIAVVPRG
jgi:DNA-binding beta-propeller fold protein YncE